jgi:hypothetical protein
MAIIRQYPHPTRPTFLNVSDKYRKPPAEELTGFYTELGGEVAKYFGQKPNIFRNGCALRMSHALNGSGIYIPRDDPFKVTSRSVRDTHKEPWEIMIGKHNPNDIEQDAKKKETYCYIFRVRLLRRFLRLVLGDPFLDTYFKSAIDCSDLMLDPKKYPEPSEKMRASMLDPKDSPNKPKHFSKLKTDKDVDKWLVKAIDHRKGIIIYECEYADATGHCDLWENKGDNRREIFFGSNKKKKQITFWELG